jgi:hypothetical protein
MVSVGQLPGHSTQATWLVVVTCVVTQQLLYNSSFGTTEPKLEGAGSRLHHNYVDMTAASLLLHAADGLQVLINKHGSVKNSGARSVRMCKQGG